MKLKFWGTRGSIPSPGKYTIKYGGNTTCIEIILESGKEIIIDAGSGMRLLGDKLISQDIHSIDFFLTHSHWDHIQGFPFFTPAFKEDFSIKIHGASPTYDRLLDIFRGQMISTYFPIQFKDLNADIKFEKIDSNGIKIDDIRVNSILINHPLETHAFKFTENSKTLIIMTDNELDHPDIAITPYKDLLEFVKNADILIHDSQYKRSEIKKFKGWGHSSWQETISFAKKANVKKLYLTHHAPSRKDSEIDSIVKKAEKISGNNLIVCGAIEGDSFEL